MRISKIKYNIIKNLYFRFYILGKYGKIAIMSFVENFKNK